MGNRGPERAWLVPPGAQGLAGESSTPAAFDLGQSRSRLRPALRVWSRLSFALPSVRTEWLSVQLDQPPAHLVPSFPSGMHTRFTFRILLILDEKLFNKVPKEMLLIKKIVKWSNVQNWKFAKDNRKASARFQLRGKLSGCK